GVAPASEIAEREHQHAAQHHVIDHHQGVWVFHTICSHAAVAHQCGNDELTNKQKNWYAFVFLMMTVTDETCIANIYEGRSSHTPRQSGNCSSNVSREESSRIWKSRYDAAFLFAH